MGLFGDIKSRVILEYKADTEQAKVALRDLQGAQKKQAQAAVQGVEDQVKAHERLAGKITLGVGIAAGAIALGIQGFKKYEEHSRLSAATAGVSIDKLRQASRGLMTDLELMSVAAAGANGKWKLTTAELQNVLGAARALELRGLMPLGEAANKLADDMRKGELGALKDLGIAYDETLAKTDKRAAAMKAINALSVESARTATTETEAVRAHGKEFEQSIDRISTALGELVIALRPVIDAAAELTSFISKSISGWATALNTIAGASGGGPISDVDNPFKPNTVVSGALGASGFAGSEITDLATLQGITNTHLANAWSQQQADRARWAAEAEAAEAELKAANAKREADRQRGITNSGIRYRASRPRDRRRGGGGGYDAEAAFGIVYSAGVSPLTLSAQEEADRLGRDLDAQREMFGDGSTPFIDEAMASLPSRRRGPKRDAAGFALGKGGSAAGLDAKPKGPTAIERAFGPPGEIDAYVSALSALRDAAGSAFEAIVTGSESAGAAIKKAIGAHLMAEGKRMFILALREGAEAIADLARGNLPGAAAHAKSAAMFGAGAIAAGVAARALGGGGAGASAGSSTGAGASASGIGLGGGGEARESRTTIILGDAWEDETQRSRALRLARRMRGADSYDKRPEGTEYS